MKKIIEGFLSEFRSKNKKRFDLDTLEKYIVVKYKGYSVYSCEGGYSELHKQIKILEGEEKIKCIKSSDYNGLKPPLKTKWQIIIDENISKWDKSKMLKFEDLLDFSYYRNNPYYQTDIEWEYIENIYNFLKQANSREWYSIEERSLELFYDEKFLTNRTNIGKGKYGILKRLKLSYEDLKMKKYGEMFIYWNRGVHDIKKIIIIENHSTFFTYKRIVETKGNVFGFIPDAIIYGEGKKIENSFSFIEEIADKSKIEVLYFGDIDSEGFGIYSRLKERYADIDIQLQHKAYSSLISICNRYYPMGGQIKNLQYFNCFLDDIKEYLNDNELKKFKYIWDNNFRIPQELINYEYLLKVK